MLTVYEQDSLQILSHLSDHMTSNHGEQQPFTPQTDRTAMGYTLLRDVTQP